ncbi:MAG TPA: CsgG/HfaB family protein [Verrucomicrobiota bacterium]|nr:CsgG/HfaB family protein [Verrucomicrobiota bacterium]HNT14942.1 CsgG/HfaB family protein [Verrucomicrobiota bacterium]
MKRNLFAILGGSVLLALPIPLRAQGDLPAVIVAPFSGDVAHIQYWQPAVGQGLAEMLITELGRINKFTVLETSELGTLKDEIKMGQDGWVDASEAVEKGGFAAADFMFTGKVTRFGNKESKIGLGGFVPGSLGKLGTKVTTADVRIDWRLVDAANRKIIKTGSSTASEKGVGFDVGVNVGGRGGNIGFDNKEFMESALGKATVKALAQIIDEVRPVPLPESGRHKQKATAANQQVAATAAAAAALRSTPGKVLAAPSNQAIIISLGTQHGFKDGDKLNLFATEDVKDDQGNVVFTDEKLVGEITIQAAQAERSRATYEGGLTIKAGWTVKAK